MANRVWGEFAFIAIFAILNSALANTNAGVNAATRVLYAMGRTKTLPRPLAHINHRFRTPDIGIIFTMILGVVLTLWLGVVYGSTLAFALIGTVITIPILVVHMDAYLAVPFFFLRDHRDRFDRVLDLSLHAIQLILSIFPIFTVFIPRITPPL